MDLASGPDRVWATVRYGDLARGRLVRALIGIRTLPGRSPGRRRDSKFCIEDFRSTPAEPSFQLLADEPSRVTVGAIARLHRMQLAYVHVDSAQEFTDFATPGFVKLAWSVDVSPYRASYSRLEFELRVDVTDARSWSAAYWYLALIGPGMHFVRRRVLGSLAGQFGWPDPTRKPRGLAAE